MALPKIIKRKEAVNNPYDIRTVFLIDDKKLANFRFPSEKAAISFLSYQPDYKKGRRK